MLALLRRRDPGALTVAILMACGLAALVYFDLGPPLAFNDDWGMAWEARQLIDHHRLAIFPEQSALAIFQAFAAWALSLGHGDQRILRLTEVLFMLVVCWCLYRLCRRMGAPARWALIGAALPLTTPLTLGMSTTFMTDLPYLALFLVGCVAAVAWVEEDRWQWVVVLVAFLAPLQRQVGAVVPLAVAVALVLASRSRRALSRSDAMWICAPLVAAVSSLALPPLLGVAPPTQGNRLRGILDFDVPRGLRALVFALPMTGLLSLPLLAGLVRYAALVSPRGKERRRVIEWARVVGLAALAVAPLLPALVFYRLFPNSASLLPGNVFTDRNLGALTLPGPKPNALPIAAGVALDAAIVVAYVVAFDRPLRGWLRPNARAGAYVLLVLSLSQLVPLAGLQTPVFDRYFVSIVAALWPLLIGAVSRTSGRTAFVWAVTAMIAGVALYCVEEQDYQAWQVARDATARLAYSLVPRDRVDAGYEANAVYLDIPLYESTGRVSGGLAQGRYDPGLALGGPPHPLLRLAFSCKADRAQGLDYSSVAGGRIIILRAGQRPAAACL